MDSQVTTSANVKRSREGGNVLLRRSAQPSGRKTVRTQLSVLPSNIWSAPDNVVAAERPCQRWSREPPVGGCGRGVWAVAVGRVTRRRVGMSAVRVEAAEMIMAGRPTRATGPSAQATRRDQR